MLSQASECCKKPLGGVLTGVLDCSVSFCSHIFKRLSRSLSSCSLKLRSRSSFFSLSRVASISHLQRDNSVSLHSGETAGTQWVHWSTNQRKSKGVGFEIGQELTREAGLFLILQNQQAVSSGQKQTQSISTKH